MAPKSRDVTVPASYMVFYSYIRGVGGHFFLILHSDRFGGLEIEDARGDKEDLA